MPSILAFRSLKYQVQSTYDKRLIYEYNGLTHKSLTFLDILLASSKTSLMDPYEPPTNSPSNAQNNPYKAKRLWPPDFAKMGPKHQFRLERRYRRRSKLAYTREGWIRGVKLVQYTSILCKIHTSEGHETASANS